MALQSVTEQAARSTTASPAANGRAEGNRPTPKRPPVKIQPKPAHPLELVVPDEDLLARWRPMWVQWLKASPSWLTSAIVHMIAVLLLALWVIPPEPSKPKMEIYSDPGEAHELEVLDPIQENIPDELDVDEKPVEIEPQPETQNVLEEVSHATADELEQSQQTIPDAGLGEDTSPIGPHSGQTNLGNSFTGRGRAARVALLREGGGTPGSEEAVRLALEWLVRHQNPDGSWSFDHRKGPCQGRCANHGAFDSSRIGATALALLPFLGAGHTHMDGAHKKRVGAGLYYLARSIRVTNNNAGDLCDPLPGGGMYSHGLASLALCEAYGMTQDRGLQVPAQLSLNFIVHAQDPVGGGWRYIPRQPGDTSVVGWQLMALKSGHMAFLQVPPLTAQKAEKFLNSVESESGAYYGYLDPGRGPATTAIGLLCRMYLGWKQDNPALQRGIQALSQTGPSTTNIYYNYYATQAIFQYVGGKAEHPLWRKWNEEMREMLVRTQAKEDHAKGSWWNAGDHGSVTGGRLYCTAMNAMTLEVYYRYMAIYKPEATEDLPDN